ncbi:MAG: hypothetical protein RBR26_11915 [Methanosarcina mazei]|nr:hypothetical protein [Methanosarcina mazei]
MPSESVCNSGVLSFAIILIKKQNIAVGLPHVVTDKGFVASVHPETPVFVRRGHSGGKTNARSAGFRNC